MIRQHNINQKYIQKENGQIKEKYLFSASRRGRKTGISFRILHLYQSWHYRNPQSGGPNNLHFARGNSLGASP